MAFIFKGHRYEGYFKNQKKHGKGQINQKINFLLLLIINMINIKGVFTWKNTDRYDGAW